MHDRRPRRRASCAWRSPRRRRPADPDAASRQLAALNELGVRLAIDDFGTGPSSGGQPGADARPRDQDRQTFVSRLGNASGARADTPRSARAVELGHALGLSVVAEGVETDAQLARLRDLGCDGAQGFLFSRPLPEEGVCSLLAAA